MVPATRPGSRRSVRAMRSWDRIFASVRSVRKPGAGRWQEHGMQHQNGMHNQPEKRPCGSAASGSKNREISGTTGGHGPCVPGMQAGSSGTAGERGIGSDHRSGKSPEKDLNEERFTFPENPDEKRPVRKNQIKITPVIPDFRFIIKAYGYKDLTGMCHTDPAGAGVSGAQRSCDGYCGERTLCTEGSDGSGGRRNSMKNIQEKRNEMKRILENLACRFCQPEESGRNNSGTETGCSSPAIPVAAGSLGTAGEQAAGSGKENFRRNPREDLGRKFPIRAQPGRTGRRITGRYRRLTMRLSAGDPERTIVRDSGIRTPSAGGPA